MPHSPQSVAYCCCLASSCSAESPDGSLVTPVSNCQRRPQLGQRSSGASWVPRRCSLSGWQRAIRLLQAQRCWCFSLSQSAVVAGLLPTLYYFATYNPSADAASGAGYRLLQGGAIYVLLL